MIISKKLNLGCAYNKLQDYINIDMDPECQPDLCFDLTTEKNWPIEDNSIDEVIADHILEHLETTKGYFNFWKELYRVCQNNALIKIEVPYWEHETFYHDPTHVRRVTPVGIAMFDQQRNQTLLLNGDRETKLGFMLKVDFEMLHCNYNFEQTSGKAITCNYVTKCIKPARYRFF